MYDELISLRCTSGYVTQLRYLFKSHLFRFDELAVAKRGRGMRVRVSKRRGAYLEDNAT